MSAPPRRFKHAALSFVAEMIVSEDELVRAAACAELGRRGKGAVTMIPTLIGALAGDKDSSVRLMATDALCLMGRLGVNGIERRLKAALRAAREAALTEQAVRLAWALERIEADGADASGDAALLD